MDKEDRKIEQFKIALNSTVKVISGKKKVQINFSNKFELDGMEFIEPNIHMFIFNNPYGACPNCNAYGDIVYLIQLLKNFPLSFHIAPIKIIDQRV